MDSNRDGHVIDLTEEDDTQAADRKRPATDIEDAIGSEMSADVIDLFGSDEEEDPVLGKPTKIALGTSKVPKQSHPRKIREASWKRRKRLEREAVTVVAAAAKEASRQKKLESDARRAAVRAAAAAVFDSTNIPGGCNFVVIDSDSDSEEDAIDDKRRRTRPSAQPAPRARPRINANAPEREVKASDTDFAGQKLKRDFNWDRDFSYRYSREDALAMQERMFREAAARVQSLKVSESYGGRMTILSPLPDIAVKYPNHWTWKDPHFCLGLPRGSSLTLIKSHYRKLARLYHPDKSKHLNCAARFHGIATAYKKLTNLE